ncbi:DNA/RNA helicase, DEAD/DEAH box type [Purpureocillium lavendulum]|uniref:DNA/RNA helicase, DEAD/DEAH box type n=1 Tax=Purpureocillium lavendulum TaxID=1247861 RepID=A0AB34FY51_9HYPO|nr:DNA/RNA helicase, DEAD/DEAH box type [Purpureocillium lavendulum]
MVRPLHRALAYAGSAGIMSNPKKRAAESTAPAKQSKKRKTKSQQQDDELLDMELGINTLFSRMDNQLLADHLAQKLSRFGGDLSSVELSDLTVSANSIRDTTEWKETRTLDHLPDFMEKFVDNPASLSKAPKKKGAPHTLIVAGAGLRAADIVRAVRKFSSKENVVAKLCRSRMLTSRQFAKHVKVDEQVAFLQNRKSGIGVGTPARLMELIDNGSLVLDKLHRIIVDASHVDQKKRGVLDMKDTMMPLARFLVRDEFKERYVDEKKPLSLLFY